MPEISPPAWGWPETSSPLITQWEDFPTRVGMARPPTRRGRRGRGFPHPRGDGPASHCPAGRVWQISPPAWGWPGDVTEKHHQAVDFPTRVGMARPAVFHRYAIGGFPHPRGDGPSGQVRNYHEQQISPPAWGWPACYRCWSGSARDFPTRVGMARDFGTRKSPPPRFPHPRGDGP